MKLCQRCKSENSVYEERNPRTGSLQNHCIKCGEVSDLQVYKNRKVQKLPLHDRLTIQQWERDAAKVQHDVRLLKK